MMKINRNSMITWLRAGRRFEWTVLVICLAWFLWMGLTFTWNEPVYQPLRWVLWVYAAILPLVVVGLAFAFGPALRGLARKATLSDARAVGVSKLTSRLSIYLIMFVVAGMLALNVAKVLLQRQVPATSIVRFFCWDVVVLVIIVAFNEISVWRKGRNLHRS
jgi:hypothetical protein